MPLKGAATAARAGRATGAAAWGAARGAAAIGAGAAPMVARVMLIEMLGICMWPKKKTKFKVALGQTTKP